MPYEAHKPTLAPTADELRDRIPGCVTDLPPENRRTLQQLEEYG